MLALSYLFTLLLFYTAVKLFWTKWYITIRSHNIIFTMPSISDNQNGKTQDLRQNDQLELWAVVKVENQEGEYLRCGNATFQKLETKAVASIPLKPMTHIPLPRFLPSLRSRHPLIQLGGLGNAVSSPSGSGWSPSAKRRCILGWKMH